jgi:hypothetical protein
VGRAAARARAVNRAEDATIIWRGNPSRKQMRRRFYIPIGRAVSSATARPRAGGRGRGPFRRRRHATGAGAQASHKVFIVNVSQKTCSSDLPRKSRTVELRASPDFHKDTRPLPGKRRSAAEVRQCHETVQTEAMPARGGRRRCQVMDDLVCQLAGILRFRGSCFLAISYPFAMMVLSIRDGKGPASSRGLSHAWFVRDYRKHYHSKRN